jgi:hypothetical protein
MDLRIVHTVGLEMCCVVVCGVGKVLEGLFCFCVHAARQNSQRQILYLFSPNVKQTANKRQSIFKIYTAVEKNTNRTLQTRNTCTARRS